MANIATSGTGMASPRQRHAQRQKQRKETPALQPFSVNDPSTFNQPARSPRPQSRPTMPASGVGNAIAGRNSTSAPATKLMPAPTPVPGTTGTAVPTSAPAPTAPTPAPAARAAVSGAAFGNAAANAFGKEMSALSGSPTIKKGTPAIKPVQPVKRATK